MLEECARLILANRKLFKGQKMVLRPGFKLASFLFVAVVFITGCGEDDEPLAGTGGGGDAVLPGSDGPGSGPSVIPEQNDPPQASSNDTSAIAGIWDDSHSGDVYYFLINDTGAFAGLDYDGDQTGLGRNCYYVNPGTVQNLGNNSYRFTYEYGFAFTLTAIVSNGQLSLKDNRGETASLPPVTGIDPNIQSCN